MVYMKHECWLRENWLCMMTLWLKYEVFPKDWSLDSYCHNIQKWALKRWLDHEGFNCRNGLTHWILQFAALLGGDGNITGRWVLGEGSGSWGYDPRILILSLSLSSLGLFSLPVECHKVNSGDLLHCFAMMNCFTTGSVTMEPPDHGLKPLKLWPKINFSYFRLII